MQLDIADLDDEILWKRFRENSDLAARSILIEKYSSLVKILAASLFAKRFDDEVEFDDFFQYGMVGLIQSLDRYEPGKGAAFQTFATYRIRGAILNGLEKETERHEQYAFRARLRKERIESVTSTEGSVRQSSLFEELVEVALGLAICYMLEDTGLVQNPARENCEQIYDSKEMSILRSRLLESIEILPEREKLIISEHYFEHNGFNEIADKLGLSKGRVSQIHKRALQMLREKLGNDPSINECF